MHGKHSRIRMELTAWSAAVSTCEPPSPTSPSHPQYLCFGQPLSDEELDSVKAMVAERMPEGLSDAVRPWGGCGAAWSGLV